MSYFLISIICIGKHTLLYLLAAATVHLHVRQSLFSVHIRQSSFYVMISIYNKLYNLKTTSCVVTK